MKKGFKRVLTLGLLSATVFGLAACSSNDKKEETKTITVGASATPHAEILEQVKDTLADEGYTLKVKVFDDYVLPNTALEDGDLDVTTSNMSLI